MRAARMALAVCCMGVIGVGLAPVLCLCAQLTSQPLEGTANARVLLLNSFAVGSLTAGLALLLGLPVAFTIRSSRGAWRSLLMVLSLLPLIMPPFVAAIAWIEIINRGGSPPFTAHGLLAMLGLSEGVVAVLESSWVMALCFFPCVTWGVLITLMRRPRELEDDARLHGGARAITRSVSLPFLAAPACVSAALVFFCHSPTSE